jgi:hypothetical protein
MRKQVHGKIDKITNRLISNNTCRHCPHGSDYLGSKRNYLGDKIFHILQLDSYLQLNSLNSHPDLCNYTSISGQREV